MKQSIISIALESQETDLVDAVSESDIDLANAEMSSEAAKIDADKDSIEEAQSIGDSVDKLTEIAEKSDEVSPDTAEVITTAMEHYCARLGYPVSRIGLESLSDKDKHKQVIAELKQMRSKLDKGVRIAQEGLISRIHNAFERATTSSGDLLKKMPEALRKLQEKGPNEIVITDPAWGRIFYDAGKSIDYHGVKKIADNIQNLSAEYVSVARKQLEILKEVTKHMASIKGEPTDDQLAAMWRLEEKSDALEGHLQKMFEGKFKEGSVQIKSLSIQEAKNLAAQLVALVKDKGLEDIFDALFDAGDEYTKVYQERLANDDEYGDYFKAADGVYWTIRNFYYCSNLLHWQFRAAYGIYKYIKASTK